MFIAKNEVSLWLNSQEQPVQEKLIGAISSDVIVSFPMYDVFFLSFDEPYAEQYWSVLKEQHPSARRCTGVPGIQAAHAKCAQMSRTRHFFVVDADNQVLKPEVFEHRVADWDAEYVHLWYARNPVNGLEYGWGGIKLFPKTLFNNLSEQRLDMTTTFPLKVQEEVASITHFDTTPYETWRSAFREAVKLTVKTDDDSKARLATWMNVGRGPNGAWSIRGAVEGHAYSLTERANPQALQRINDYAWLKERFERP